MTDTAVPTTALSAARLTWPRAVNDEIDACRPRRAGPLACWERDASLWTSDENVAATIANRLGWLDAPDALCQTRSSELEAFARRVVGEGFTDAVVCGMGGSSLAPDVLAQVVPAWYRRHPGPRARLDRPAGGQGSAIEASDPARTLYLIATKSGTTTETLRFLAHFWQVEAEQHHDVPAGSEGEQFVAITDPEESTGTTGRIRSIMACIEASPTATPSARCSSTRRTWAAATAR